LDGSTNNIKYALKEDRYMKLLNSIKSRVKFNYKLSEVFRAIFCCF